MIDKNVGIAALGGDEELYTEILSDYIEESVGMIEKIKTAYASEDWKNYTVYVHGLKSASKSVGAIKVADAAYHLEMSGKEGNVDEIKKCNDDLIKLHQDTLDFIESME